MPTPCPCHYRGANNAHSGVSDLAREIGLSQSYISKLLGRVWPADGIRKNLCSCRDSFQNIGVARVVSIGR